MPLVLQPIILYSNLVPMVIQPIILYSNIVPMDLQPIILYSNLVPMVIQPIILYCAHGPPEYTSGPRTGPEPDSDPILYPVTEEPEPDPAV